ncbi:MAG: PAS domain S-box protein [Chloroflexi bacterium]|uniref:histidine kinase n=1 Tax=Candidatus Chlorohelix allophototropha TaxID=3003348 RepID=A0A8T7LVT6_9CHLR|nr:PAS domain S-box protein [Chloroflexota bacterium]WJW65507.1 PAS domain S-box protein [Chloroflexota bacterium L227-S17]
MPDELSQLESLETETLSRRIRELENQLEKQKLQTLEATSRISELEHAEQRVLNLTNLYSALSYTNHAIVRIKDRNQLFHEICRVAVDYGGLRMAWIGIPDPVTNLFINVACYGEGQDYLKGVKISTSADVPEGRGPSGTAFRENRRYVCNDFFADPVTLPWRDSAKYYGFASSAAFPLLEQGCVVGLITLYSSKPHYFDPDIINLIEEMAQDISFALDNFLMKKQRAAVLERLFNSEERFRAIFEQAAVGITLLSLDGQYLQANPQICKILGYTEEEFLQLTTYDITHPDDDKINREMLRKLQIGEFQQNYLEKRYIKKDGSIIWVSLNPALVRDSAGNPAYFIGVTVDITSRKQAEEALHQVEEQFRQAQKMEAIGRLAGGVAHDFNNLLTAIIGHTDLALEELNPGNSIRSEVEGIRKVAESATSLTRQLLTLSRHKVIEPRPLDLNKVVAEIEKMLLRLIGENIKLSTKLESNLEAVLADPNQIEQVIMNLVVNSRDAMPNGGSLSLETAQLELDEKYCQTHPEVIPGSYIMLAVSDTGQGISEEIKSKIFEPFFTTKDKGQGTGLGLSTVYGIVKQTGGHIALETSLGYGTTFRIYLPVSNEKIGVLTQDKSVTLTHTKGVETILLAEDDNTIRKLTGRILCKKGYNVLEASNPQEALILAKDYNAPIHLLITDMLMPEMNGWEFSQLLLKDRPNIKVLYTSGYTQTTIFKEQTPVIEINFLEKPYNIQSLSEKVRQILDNK